MCLDEYEKDVNKKHRTKKMSRWFVIEGNIGSGKSTLCRMLEEENQKIEVIPEPVDAWKACVDDVSSKNLLQCYYEDQYRWGFTFQLYGLLTRMEDIMKEMGEGKELRFVERSIYSYKHVFARSLYEAGKMTPLEWKMYEGWFDWLSQEKFGTLHQAKGYIYLRANCKTSYDRMVKRERSEEKALPLEYLENINQYHDEWLKTMEKKDILIIDVDDDFEHNEEVWKEMYKKIIDFVQERI